MAIWSRSSSVYGSFWLRKASRAHSLTWRYSSGRKGTKKSIRLSFTRRLWPKLLSETKTVVTRGLAWAGLPAAPPPFGAGTVADDGRVPPAQRQSGPRRPGAHGPSLSCARRLLGAPRPLPAVPGLGQILFFKAFSEKEFGCRGTSLVPT